MIHVANVLSGEFSCPSVPAYALCIPLVLGTCSRKEVSIGLTV